MERRGANTWLVAVLAIAVGFLAALLIFGGGSGGKTTTTVSSARTTTTTAPATTTTTTETGAAPQSPKATTAACIALWNRPANRGAQTFLVNIASQQPIRVNVGKTSDVPPQCLVTVVANNGDAYTFPEGGGTTYPYAPGPGKTSSRSLPPEQKTSNALEQRDGTLAES